MHASATLSRAPMMVGHPMDTKGRRWARVEPRTSRDTRRPWYTTDAAS
ncbi:MAG TPA: hypothetical protein VL422_04585 [Miltoncostaea sp.]|jgi:hypothetical protein|nr:hypothetical protein [Miltoncostaea sp.]